MRIGNGFQKELMNPSNSSLFKTWLDITAAEKGDAWYNSKIIVNSGASVLQGGAVDLVAGYVNDINKQIGINIPPQDRPAIVESAVDKYITDNGISDKTGKIRTAILSGLVLPDPTVYNTGTTELQVGTSYVGGAGNAPAPVPTAPPPPAYVSPYLLNQSAGSYTLPTQDPSAFFFRKTSLPGAGVLTGAPGGGPTLNIAPPVEPPPSPNIPVIPKIKSIPVGGSSGGGRFTNQPIRL